MPPVAGPRGDPGHRVACRQARPPQAGPRAARAAARALQARFPRWPHRGVPWWAPGAAVAQAGGQARAPARAQGARAVDRGARRRNPPGDPAAAAPVPVRPPGMAATPARNPAVWKGVAQKEAAGRAPPRPGPGRARAAPAAGAACRRFPGSHRAGGPPRPRHPGGRSGVPATGARPALRWRARSGIRRPGRSRLARASIAKDDSSRFGFFGGSGRSRIVPERPHGHPADHVTARL